jgi:hypothetical protein
MKSLSLVFFTGLYVVLLRTDRMVESYGAALALAGIVSSVLFSQLNTLSF